MAQHMNGILVVDDDSLISSFLSDFFGEFGCSSVSASSALEALWLVGKNKPAVAIVDIRLASSMDGIGLAKLLRNMFEIPVIFFSGTTDDALLDRALLTRPFDFLQKPFRPSELLCAVERAMLKIKPIEPDEATPAIDPCL